MAMNDVFLFVFRYRIDSETCVIRYEPASYNKFYSTNDENENTYCENDLCEGFFTI